MIKLNIPLDHIRIDSSYDFNDTVFFLDETTIKRGKVIGVSVEQNIGEAANIRLRIKCECSDCMHDEDEEVYQTYSRDEKSCYVSADDVLNSITIDS